MSVPDPYLIFLNTVSIFTAYSFFKEKRNYWLGFVHNNGIRNTGKRTCSHCITRRCNIYMVDMGKKMERNFFMENIVAGIIMFAVALPWYLLVDRATNGEWTKGFFCNIT
jgi:hypothetical protein